MTKWEYMTARQSPPDNRGLIDVHFNPHANRLEDNTVSLHKFAEKILNPLGQEGWELISVSHTNQGYPIYYLKRPISN